MFILCQICFFHTKTKLKIVFKVSLNTRNVNYMKPVKYDIYTMHI